MSYYVRAFCTSEHLPPLRTVFNWTADQGVPLQAPSADLDADVWEQVEVDHRTDGQRFIAELNTGELLREEVEEFVEFLEDIGESREKQAVLEHLEKSKAVVAAQPLGDIDEDTLTAIGAFLTYYREHCGGLIQADGEGFYFGDRLVVELE